MRSALLHAAIGVSIVASTMVFTARDASACGGCFAPPENPTVVTDHRMILTIAKDQTTLYDQIQYSGAPASFAWVLPISGTVDVGLSSDRVFQALDQLTETQIIPPPRNCPPAPQCQNDSFSAAGTAADAGAATPGVVVTKREVVGPYDTVQLHSTDANALQTWLAQNQFSVPADIAPVIDQYVAEHFDFLALKLLPGQGVQDMRPVRVTTPGASAVLPLRMVAAGTGSTVGISLWLLGDGRYEPQNFPTFSIKADELSWDWTANRSNYTDLRAQRAATGGGKAWEIESSQVQNQQGLHDAVVGYGYYNNTDPTYAEQQAQQDYLPITDQNGAVTSTAVEVRDADLAALLHGFAGSLRVTRMRGDIAHAALDADLVLTASADQSELGAQRVVTKELNQPLCPVYNGCEQVGTAPRDEAAAQSSSGESFSCSTAHTDASHAWLGAGLGYMALAMARTIRRRKSR
jgi:MYXO-CTERM domain-containing protein